MRVKRVALLLCIFMTLSLVLPFMTVSAEDTLTTTQGFEFSRKKDNEEFVKAVERFYNSSTASKILTDGDVFFVCDDKEISYKKGGDTKLDEGTTGVWKINKNIFDEKKSDEQHKLLKAFMSELQRVEISQEGLQYIHDDIKSINSNFAGVMIGLIYEDTKADLFTAMKMFAPFQSPLSVFFGICVIIIVTLLVLTTVIDLAAIGFSPFNEYLTSKAEKSEGKKPFGISTEAWSAMKEAQASIDKGYKNPYPIYFKRRALTYFLLALCILYLLAGQISGLIGFLMDLVSGMV